MSDEIAPTPAVQTAWGMDLAAASCGHCHTRYLINADTPPVRCPLCYQTTLQIVSDSPGRAPFPYPPELVLPFRLSEAQLEEAVHDFAAGIPFAPGGLNPAELRSRLVKLYLPMWLVDSLVSANWQGEAGFDYQVVSHREAYHQNLGGWKSSEVSEQRVRWENRVGRINRAYQNVVAPALDDIAQLEKKLGSFQLDSVQSYTSDCIHQALIRVPDHTREESWGETAAAFQKTAAEDCRRACSAGHMRQFRWKARFTRQNWTLLLLPLYSTYYQDDHGEVQAVLIHGQTGAICGPRRASERRAARTGLLILIIGVLLLLTGLLSGNQAPGSNLANLTTFLVVVGMATVLASCIPYLSAWDFNRRQTLEEMKS